MKPCSVEESTKNWRTPEGAGLTRARLFGAMEVHAAGRVPDQSAAGCARCSEAPCSPLDDDQVLAVARRSCKLDPLSKCSTKIRPMLRVQATAAMDETARRTRPLPGTM